MVSRVKLCSHSIFIALENHYCQLCFCVVWFIAPHVISFSWNSATSICGSNYTREITVTQKKTPFFSRVLACLSIQLDKSWWIKLILPSMWPCTVLQVAWTWLYVLLLPHQEAELCRFLIIISTKRWLFGNFKSMEQVQRRVSHSHSVRYCRSVTVSVSDHWCKVCLKAEFLKQLFCVRTAFVINLAFWY